MCRRPWSLRRRCGSCSLLGGGRLSLLFGQLDDDGSSAGCSSDGFVVAAARWQPALPCSEDMCQPSCWWLAVVGSVARCGAGPCGDGTVIVQGCVGPWRCWLASVDCLGVVVLLIQAKAWPVLAGGRRHPWASCSSLEASSR